MKLVILNGSPQKNGTVARMLQLITNNVNPEYELKWIDVYDLKMMPCQGCMKCRSTKACCLPQDDAHLAGETISQADALLIGTPTHWGNMSTQLKLLFDRNVFQFMNKNVKGMPVPLQKGKKAVIVTACSAPFPLNFISAESRGAIRAVKQVMGYGGYHVLKTLAEPGTKPDKNISQKTRKIAMLTGSKI